jgi:DNA-binding transcriptional LysR family regulator
VQTALVDLDLALVRSFVVTAERMHFGGAADQLHLTQQALSKRIRRLEEELSVPLFLRTTRTVSLTPAGERFLPYAREMLATANAAVAALAEVAPPLRVDVLDDRLAPMALLRRVLATDPDLQLEISMRRSLVAATSALERGEIDLAFGRVQDLGRPLPTGLRSLLVRLEPMRVLVGADHPLAGRTEVPVAELRQHGLWVPNPGSAVEWDSYLLHLADEFDLPLEFQEAAATLEELTGRIRQERRRVTLTGADMPLPGGSGLCTIALVDPEPVYPWSLVWPRHGHPVASGLVAAAATAGGLVDAARRPGVIPADQGEQWLPEPDRATLRPQPAARSTAG